jgi:hypothetical protein
MENLKKGFSDMANDNFLLVSHVKKGNGIYFFDVLWEKQKGNLCVKSCLIL